jgi:excisionase family DNA binding protein
LTFGQCRRKHRSSCYFLQHRATNSYTPLRRKYMSSHIRVSRICKLCFKEFEARTTVTNYCSHACASRAYKEKTRREKVKQSDAETNRALQRPLVELQARDFLSVEQAVRILGVSRWTLYRAIRDGVLTAARIRRRVLLRRRDLDYLFNSSSEKEAVPKPPQWVPRTQAQAATGLSDKAFYSLLKRNQVLTRREGRGLLVDMNVVLQLMQAEADHEKSYEGTRPQQTHQ